MRFAGRLTDWNDDKGYGFVVPNGGGDRAFVHVKAFERASRRPVVGDLLSYEAERDAKGRTNAVRVRHAGQLPLKQKAPGGRGLQVPQKPLAFASLAALAVAGWTGKLPMFAVGAYCLMSVVSFALYWHDKRLAVHGEYRTPENVLHAADILGGWPGGLLAQGLLRHKSIKGRFQFTFWFTVLVNCVIVYYLLRGLK